MLASFQQAPVNILTEDKLKHIFLYKHPIFLGWLFQECWHDGVVSRNEWDQALHGATSS
jgi:hypothetical protein